MYEDITYQTILKNMLEEALRKNPDIDTREGSVVWLGQAPAAVELQLLYLQLDSVLRETFASTASRPYLIKRAAERGITPRPATKTVGEAEFTPGGLEVQEGVRFSINELVFRVTEKVRPGVYRVECETEGEAGNSYLGTLVPVGYVNGLETARLTRILIPGENEEDTESLRRRYFGSLEAQAFGGNVADYTEKVSALSGVGGVKVHKVWNGGIRPSELCPPAGFDSWFGALPEGTPGGITAWLSAVREAAGSGLLTVGGAVRLVIIDSSFSKPSALLIETVQNEVDPPESHSEGEGFAPIGHFVTVVGVEETTVNVSVRITYQDGWDWSSVKHYAESAIDGYFKELAGGWADSDEPVVVRVSQIETRLLALGGVVDVSGTQLNGEASNLILEPDHIPVRGVVYG